MSTAAQRGDPRINFPQPSRQRLSTSTVITPVAPLRRKANRRSGQETQLLYGHQFDVYAVSKGWAWGQARSPVKGSKVKGYIGYVASKYLTEKKSRPSHVIKALKAPIFVAPNIKSYIIGSLPMGALIKGQVSQDDFLKIEAGGYVHRKHIRKQNDPAEIIDFVAIAESYMGLPYIWGGISSDGLDCSGLVLSSLRAIDEDAPRDADMMETSLGSHLPVSQNGLKRGDLVFWKGHVGIMQTARRLLHANAHHMCVATEPLSEAAARILKCGGGKITAIKRL